MHWSINKSMKGLFGLKSALVMVALAVATFVLLRFRASANRSADAIQPVAHYPAVEDSDEGVLQQLRADGSDLTKKTDIVNYLYIPSLKDAKHIAEHLSRAGYEVEVREPLGRRPDGEIESRYSLLIHITEVPSIDNIRRIRHLLDKLAQRFNGDYDGWEAQVQQ